MDRNLGELGRIPKEKVKRKIKQSTWRKDLPISFKENLDIINNLITIDSNDEILRVQISFLMSLYDYTIHEIIKYKMIDIFNGTEAEPQKYKSFKVSIKTLKHAINFPENPLKWLPYELDFQTDKISYINPYKTLEALELITDINIFEQYCTDNGLIYKTFLENLKALSIRRNQIVHSMDIKDKRTLERHQINSVEVISYINHIQNLILYIIEKI